jgi:hypothetical protein
MKAQTQFFTAAAATAIAGLVSAAPAQAFTFNNSGISFNEDTTVNFDFVESHGWFQSNFGVIDSTGKQTVLFSETKRSDGSGPDNQGTCGNTVLICSTAFKFEAGKQYAFFLDSGTDVWGDYDIYSSDSMNASGLGFANQFKFLQGTSVIDNDLNEDYKYYNTSVNSALGQTGGIQNANPFAGPVLIAIEDSGVNGHRDFNDFMVTAQVAVPEPATLAGLGMIAGAMAMSRRRKTNHSA